MLTFVFALQFRFYNGSDNKFVVKLYLDLSGLPFVISDERDETRKVSYKRRKRAIRVSLLILVESNILLRTTIPLLH